MPSGLNAVSMLKKSFIMIQSMGQSKNLKKRLKQNKAASGSMHTVSLQKMMNPATITYL